YHTDGTAIGGLTNNTFYYVITTGDSRLIKLAANPNDVGGVANPSPPPPTFPEVDVLLNPAIGSGHHQLVREAIGGLQDGVTYYLKNPLGGSFQLTSDSAGLNLVNVTPTVSKGGTHQFFKAGADLVASSGDEELRIDLTTAGTGSTQKLLGP